MFLLVPNENGADLYEKTMGWTDTYKPKGEAIAAFFYRHGATRWSDDAAHTYQVIDSALVAATTWYAAVERICKKSGTREVFALVFLVRMRRTKEPGAFNFCYKAMSEDMGPNEARCPKRMLDLLTPTSSASAQDWRERCLSYHSHRDAVPRISAGVVLRFSSPLTFGLHGQATEFTVLSATGQQVTCTPSGLAIRAALPRSLIRQCAAEGRVTFLSA